MERHLHDILERICPHRGELKALPRMCSLRFTGVAYLDQWDYQFVVPESLLEFACDVGADITFDIYLFGDKEDDEEGKNAEDCRPDLHRVTLSIPGPEKDLRSLRDQMASRPVRRDPSEYGEVVPLESNASEYELRFTTPAWTDYSYDDTFRGITWVRYARHVRLIRECMPGAQPTLTFHATTLDSNNVGVEFDRDILDFARGLGATLVFHGCRVEE